MDNIRDYDRENKKKFIIAEEDVNYEVDKVLGIYKKNNKLRIRMHYSKTSEYGRLLLFLLIFSLNKRISKVYYN